jgi:hypothetical protein
MSLILKKKYEKETDNVDNTKLEIVEENHN